MTSPTPEPPAPDDPPPVVEPPVVEPPVVEPPVVEPPVVERAPDDEDVGWGGAGWREEPDDERYLRERPPHWE